MSTYLCRDEVQTLPADMNETRLRVATTNLHEAFLYSLKHRTAFIDEMLREYLLLTESQAAVALEVLSIADAPPSPSTHKIVAQQFLEVFSAEQRERLIQAIHTHPNTDYQPHQDIAVLEIILPLLSRAVIIRLARFECAYLSNISQQLASFNTICGTLLESCHLQETQSNTVQDLHAQLAHAQTLNQDLAYKEEELTATEEELRQTNQHLHDTNKMLAESEQKYKHLFENSPIPMWIYDVASLQFLAVNHTATLKYGYTQEEFLQMNLLDIRPKEEGLRLEHLIQRGLPTYQNSQVWQHLTKSGETIYAEIIGHALHYEGKSARFVLANDITERLRAEQELHTNKTHLKAIFDNALGDKFLLDNDCQVIQVNAPAYKSLKVHFGETDPIGKPFMDFVVAHRRDKVLEILQRNQQGENAIDEELIHLPSGKSRWLRGYYTPIKQADGNISGILVSIYDITASKQNLLEIAKMNEVLQSLLDNIPIIVAMLDGQGKFSFCNRTWLNVLGYSLDDAQSPQILTALYPDAQYREEVIQFMATGIGWRDFETRSKSGKVIDISWYNVRLSNGIVIGIGQDISQRKQHEQQISTQNQQLREYAFTNSHKLRRPVANILGLVSLFNAEDFADPFNDTVIQKLLVSAQELDAIIHEMNRILSSVYD